jgi:hypothetical protein
MNLDIWEDYNNQSLKTDLFKLLWNSFSGSLNEKHKEFINIEKNENNKAFSALSFTAYMHEARHFHDFCSTPYGALLVRQHVNKLFYFLVVQDIIQQLDYLCIPLGDWYSALEKIPENRLAKNIVKHIDSFVKKITNNDFLNNANFGIYNPDNKYEFELFKDVRSSHNLYLPTITSNSIIESLAFLEQINIIINNFGYDVGVSVAKFTREDRNFILKYASPLCYATLANFESGKNEALMATLYGSLFGYEKINDKLPPLRFPCDMLTKFLKEQKSVKGLLNATDIMNQWNTIWKKYTNLDIEGLLNIAINENRDFLSYLNDSLEFLHKHVNLVDTSEIEYLINAFNDYSELFKNYSFETYNQFESEVILPYDNQYKKRIKPFVIIESQDGFIFPENYGEGFHEFVKEQSNQKRVFLFTESIYKEQPFFYNNWFKIATNTLYYPVLLSGTFPYSPIYLQVAFINMCKKVDLNVYDRDGKLYS